MDKYLLLSAGYGILRNFYYIPKIQNIDKNYDTETRKFIAKKYEPLLGNKILMCLEGIITMPVFFPVAMYDDMNRIQLYYNSEARKEYQDYLVYNLFPYTSFSIKKGCFDKNLE